MGFVPVCPFMHDHSARHALTLRSERANHKERANIAHSNRWSEPNN
jgi:hypothetical protein